MAWCARCKCCEAQSGFILCVFCEDGVPCPNQKRKGPSLALAMDAKGAVAAVVATPAKKSASKPAPDPAATQVKRHEDPSQVAPPRAAEKIPAAAHTGNLQERVTQPRPDGLKRKVQSAQPEPTPEARKEKMKSTNKSPERVCSETGCGRKLRRRDNTTGKCVDHAGKHTKQTPTAGPVDVPRNAEGKRVCACGCGTPLVNRHPYIKGHNQNQGAPAKGSRPSPPRNSIAVRRKGDSAVATICVTEEHLDRFWQNRSLEEKAELFTRYLEGS